MGQQDLAPFNSTLGAYVPALYVGTNGLLYAQMNWGTEAQLESTNAVNDGPFHHLITDETGNYSAVLPATTTAFYRLAQ